MLRFIGKRILMMIPVLIGVTLIIFTMMYLTPGDAADMLLGDSATIEQKEQLREELKLNDPYLVQYFNYMKGVFHGDLGTSYSTKRPVTEELLDRFPTTIKLAGAGVLLSLIFGVSMGIISATKQYSIFDNLATTFSLLGVSIPNFWLALMLIIIFAVNLKILPPSGLSSPLHWILPVISLGMNSTATIMRMTRSSMLEVVRQDYIRTARAKGQKESLVILRHALPNALIPIITVAGLQFGRLMGGAVMAETVFSIAGIGKLMVDAIKLQNFPIVQGGVLLIAFSTSIVNLLIDILYAFVDPRIRSQYIRPKKNKQEALKGGAPSNG
ncbi:MAG TPA: ABC transporter permease [Candidatus Copromonas faecavium]|uniref:ABC transporter permease n=1 Tax=Candidatus Copromonas faecavium (nom. illeg.) TaxID=2840740 RepID=A0A9D1D5X7_9FIRM|nr:ABC transporter permease [Candidatus Copromonas faecavium]